MVASAPVQSPFKFLDAYTARDVGRFFGREGEKKRLIELIFSSRMILLYGASGTGKSSLVQCGLAESLSRADYFPVIIRRRDHFPTSLINILSDLVQRKQVTDPVALTRSLVNYSLSPVYLIFDQFEELFISGRLEEQQQFFQQLKELFESGISCKILLVMREEYLGYLYPFEKYLPDLFDFRLRVEPMRESALEEVITGTFEKAAGIRLESPIETAELIIQNTKSKKDIFQLPYLQVYLDRLWKAGLEKSKESGGSVIRIHSDLVNEVGPIEDVLEVFLSEQKQALKEGLSDEQKLNIDRLLEAFVTYEGTRRVHTAETLEKEPGLERGTILPLLKRLESLRILREDEGQYELSHDSLAKVIDQERSSEQQKINDIIRRLKDAYREYIEKGKEKDLLLPARRLTEIEVFEEALKTELSKTSESSELWQYIEASRLFIHQEQQAELAEQKRKNKQLRNTIVGVGIVLIVAITALIFAFYQWREAQQTTDKANALYWASESDKLLPTQAIRLLEKAACYNLDAVPVYERLFRRFNESDLLYKVGFPHQDVVSSAVFSPDGTQLLTASEDNTAKLWDTQGKLLATLNHQDAVTSAVFSPDGIRLLTASRDNTAKLWDTQGKLLTTITHDSYICSAVFSPDGTRLLTASRDKTAKLWDTQGKLLATLTHQNVVSSAVFSPDGTRLLTASGDKLTSYDNTAKLWDTQGKLLVTLTHDSYIFSAVFSPDGTRLLTASYDKTAKLWDTQGNLLTTLTHQDVVSSAVFSPDGTWLLTASGDKTAKLWDTQGKLLATLTHDSYISSAVFFPDGTRLLTASYDNTAKLWNIQGNLLATLTHDSYISSAVFSPDGTRLLTASYDNTAKLWDTQGKLLATLTHDSYISSAIFSPDGTRLLTASYDNTAKLWNTQGKLLATLTHQDIVSSAVFSPDGTRLLTASGDKLSSRDNTAKLWDTQGKLLVTLTHQHAVSSAVFSPDGTRLLTASEDNTAKLWDTQGKLLATLTHQDVVSSATFSPDGTRLITASGDRLFSRDNTAKLWDTQGNLLATLTHQNAVYSAVFSPDGTRLMTASGDKTAKLWDTQGKLLATLTHQNAVISAVFSPDGLRLLTASYDNTAKLWFTAEGALKWLKENNDKVAPLSEENKMKYGIDE